jgi:membrane associated rhomboid family serine protease
MSDQREDFDVKRCAKCAAWIPTTATKCSYCDTSSPDQPPVRTRGSLLSLRHGVSATNALIAVNGAFFLFSLLVARWKGVEGNLLQWATTGTGFGEGIFIAGGYYHPAVAAGQWWRILGATFLHFGLLHIAMNMYALSHLGRVAEQLFGTAKFLTVYLLSGVGSTIAITVWFAYVQGKPDGALMAGASGSIFGVMGLLAVVLLRGGSIAAQQMGRGLVKDVIVMLAIGFVVPMISNTGHVGGLLVGAACGLFVKDRFSERLDPSSRGRWTRIAVVMVFAAAASLAAAAWFAMNWKGGA